MQLQPTTPAAPKSNPFGNAKPVDVSARLKELDERDAKRKVHPGTIARALFHKQGTAPAASPARCIGLYLLPLRKPSAANGHIVYLQWCQRRHEAVLAIRADKAEHYIEQITTLSGPLC